MPTKRQRNHHPTLALQIEESDALWRVWTNFVEVGGGIEIGE
jgi:hypothetical protein